MTGTALEQTPGTSGEALFSQTGCFSSRSSSAIRLLPVAVQFSTVGSNPSRALNSTVEEEEEAEEDVGMLSSRTAATYFLGAVSFVDKFCRYMDITLGT